jgi:hypothetical protein
MLKVVGYGPAYAAGIGTQVFLYGSILRTSSEIVEAIFRVFRKKSSRQIGAG